MVRFKVALAAVLLTAATGAGATQFVVVDAKGEARDKLPAGSVVDDAVLDVPDHASVTLMSASGQTIEVPGPHHGPVNAPSGGDPGLLQRLSSVMNDRPASFGATRGGALKPAPAGKDVWAIDTTLAGTACVFQGRAPTLWKPGSSDAVTGTITNDATKTQAPIAWPAGTASIAWPDALPVAAGGYTVISSKGPQAITLKQVQSAANEGQGAMIAAAAGCERQAGDLLDYAQKHPLKP